MSDTCIVCLGDLNASVSILPCQPGSDGKDLSLEGEDGGGGGGDSGGGGRGGSGSPSPSHANSLSIAEVISPPELIAHLLPCGHNLHDECLKPWVERANSCPICRRNFNEVELCRHLNGPIVSSYAVADRTQVAEIDPSMLIEEIDEPEFPPCSKCGQEDNEDVLMLCDGCEQASHTYCVDLNSVPVGHWFCDDCSAHRAPESVAEPTRPSRPRRTGIRTRAQVRQARQRDQTTSSDWARVWQAVSDRAGFDLDFPHEGVIAYSSVSRSSSRRRRRAAAWERRLQVAERQGASNRFREGAEALFDRPTVSRPRPEPPEPESLEEVLAWNAFEKARDIQADPAPKSRKRKSTTASPSEPESHRSKKRRRSATASPGEPLPAPKPERRLKRPQTRRAFDINESASDIGEGPSSRRRSIVNGHHSPDATNGTTPSFLQSLLKEVESSAIPDEASSATVPSNMITSDHPSPGLSSPGGSPTASNHPSPRAMSATPPPLSARSNSPAPLTSKVEPIFPVAPDLNQVDLPTLAQPKPQHRHRNSKSQTRIGRWALQTIQSSSPQRPRSEESSPTRLNMSLLAKESVQKLVKEALKLPYQEKKITKDEYTDINRNVSRMLYEQVGEEGNVTGATADVWRKMAFDEVEKALLALQTETDTS